MNCLNSEQEITRLFFVEQYNVDEWHKRLGGGTQADSIMDCIILNSYPLPTSETNLRKIYDNQKRKNLVDQIESK